MRYAIKKIDISEEGLIEVTRFLKEIFPNNKKFSLDFIRWQYAHNPLGEMIGFNAWDNGRIISHFAALPINMNLFGKLCKGLLCINVSTNINYRGNRLFTILGEKTIEYAKSKGYDFFIAVPNANSTHAFLKYFQFQFISPLSVKVGLGKNIYPQKAAKCYKIWDDKQWQWRLNNPSNKYAQDKKEIVMSPISFFAKSVSKGQSHDNRCDINLQNIGFRPLNLYIGLGADVSKGFYFNIPSFIKRPPFNLVFKDLTGGRIPRINKDDIFLQLIDLDTI